MVSCACPIKTPFFVREGRAHKESGWPGLCLPLGECQSNGARIAASLFGSMSPACFPFLGGDFVVLSVYACLTLHCFPCGQGYCAA